MKLKFFKLIFPTPPPPKINIDTNNDALGNVSPDSRRAILGIGIYVKFHGGKYSSSSPKSLEVSHWLNETLSDYRFMAKQPTH